MDLRWDPIAFQFLAMTYLFALTYLSIEFVKKYSPFRANLICLIALLDVPTLKLFINLFNFELMTNIFPFEFPQ